MRYMHCFKCSHQWSAYVERRLQEFFDCQCIDDGQATAGFCPQNCWSMYVFAVVVFTTFLLNSTMVVPFITVILRYALDVGLLTALSSYQFVSGRASLAAACK